VGAGGAEGDARMSETLFVWSADTAGSGTYTERYRHTTWVPDIAQPDGGRAVRHSAVPLLDGSTLVLIGGRAGHTDQRSPGVIELSFALADPDFLAVAEEDYARGRTVQVRLDHRWRQLAVTSSGAADRKVLIAAGYLLSGGDTYWLGTAAEVTCAAEDTVVYVIPAAGALTADSGTSLAEGAVQVAAISIAGDVVTVTSDPSGVANARTGVVVGWETRQNGPMTGLTLKMQETV